MGSVGSLARVYICLLFSAVKICKKVVLVSICLVGLTLGLQRNSFTKDGRFRSVKVRHYFRTYFRITFLNFEYFQFKSWSEKSFEQWQFELPHPHQSQVQFKRRSKDYYFTIESQPRVLELSSGIEILTKNRLLWEI